MKNFIIFLILILLPQFVYAKENLKLKGYWFECEFSEKTTPPKDQCEMLDDDGFNFKEDVAVNIKNKLGSKIVFDSHEDWPMLEKVQNWFIGKYYERK